MLATKNTYEDNLTIDLSEAMGHITHSEKLLMFSQGLPSLAKNPLTGQLCP